jgi:hypothetical protein
MEITLSDGDPEPRRGTTLVSITLTDAAGRYRLDNVPAGRYHLVVGRVEYPTYYPGVAALKDAGVVAVGDGARLDGFDFKIVLPQVLKVSGRINVQAAAQPPVLIRLRASGFMLTPTSIGADGSFEFNDVSPGEYDLRTTAVVLPTLKITVVDKDITGLEIPTRQ